jgi:predicted acylesterase/phospholipase RssA
MSGPSVPEQPVQGNQTDDASKVDLVLQGGGVRGIGLVGAVNTLRAVSSPMSSGWRARPPAPSSPR